MHITGEHVDPDGDYTPDELQNVDGGAALTINRDLEAPCLTREDGIAAEPVLTCI